VKLHNRAVLALSGLALAAGAIAAAGPAAAQSAGTHQSVHNAAKPMPVRGTGHGTLLRTVNVRALAARPQIVPRPWNRGPLGRNGKVAGSALPVRPSTGVKPAPAKVSTRVNRAAGVKAALTGSPPTTVNANFKGVTQGSSNCGACQPPDVNAAVSSSEIAHTVNLRLQVYSKSGTLKCGVGLNTLAGTSDPLSDPRVMWDNIHHRFFMVFIPVPTSDSDTPTEFLLATQTADACGSWFVFQISFSGSAFPAGTLLDYPYLGQDNVPTGSFAFGGSILSSTNNFCCSSSNFGTYEGSTAFAIPKAPVYSGSGFSFSAFSVDFSTAPVTQGGVPTVSTTNTYWLASVPGSGYDLYVMTHSSQPGTTLTLQASVPAAFNAPSRRVNQPGTTQTLDPLDGRIVWSPVRAGSFIWFTNGVDRGGFPGVRYGAISVTSNTATVATAQHSSTSDDFNPSLTVTPMSGSQILLWLNWAYTDTTHGVPTTVAVNGVLPGTGVPNLTGQRKIFTGSKTASNFRFGDFSSVEVDPVAASSSCAKGRTAVLAQEYFNGSGNWVTRIARTSFC
jgi:hypothetical protein